MLTVKQLTEAGFTEEQAKKIIELHKADLDGNFEPKERNQELRDQVKQLKEDLASRDKSIEELKSSAGASDELKKTISELQETLKSKDKESEDKLAALRKQYAIRAELTGKVHDVDVALGLLDLDKIEVDDNGKVKKGFKEQFDAIAKEKSYLVIKQESGKKVPGVRVFGEGVPEGDGVKKKEVPTGVTFAKEAAARRNEAKSSSKKAADAYFGGK